MEVMAVVVIIGIVMTFMTLSTGGDKRAEQMQREAQRLLALLSLASDEAVMRSEQLALRIEKDNYTFMVLDGKQWQPLNDDQQLRPRQLPADMELRLELEDTSATGFNLQGATMNNDTTPDDSGQAQKQPQIFLLSSGEMTPFVLTLSMPESEQRYHIKAGLLGHLELE